MSTDTPALSEKIALIRMAETLEEILLNLCRVGNPRLSKHSNGWYCSVEMHVAAAGTQFKVSSEFGHTTPTSAARECTDRVIETLNQWAQ